MGLIYDRMRKGWPLCRLSWRGGKMVVDEPPTTSYPAALKEHAMSDSPTAFPNATLDAHAVLMKATAAPTAPAFQPPHVAQAYLISAVQAVLTGTQLVGLQPGVPQNVKDIVGKVQTGLIALQPQIQAPVDASSWQSAATQVIGMVQGVYPTIAPFIGPAAPYVSLALMVAQMVITVTQTALPAPSQLHLAST